MSDLARARVVLFRGLNVGKANRISMADLRDALAEAGCAGARTYLQSGNVVLRPPAGMDDDALERHLERVVSRRTGGDVLAFVRSTAELRSIVDGNPFPAAAAEPRSLHVFVVADEVREEALQRLAEVARATERIEGNGRAIYLHAPDGIGRSKLVASAERRLGVATTSRNWRTVTEVLALAEAQATETG